MYVERLNIECYEQETEKEPEMIMVKEHDISKIHTNEP